MSSPITPSVKPATAGQIEQLSKVLEAAYGNGFEIALRQLKEDDQIDHEKLNRVLGNGGLMKTMVVSSIKKMLQGLACNGANSFLERIFARERLTITSTSGNENLVHATDVFGDIELNVGRNNVELDVKCEITEEIEPAVYSLKKNMDLRMVLEAFGKPLEDLCLTQHQIKNFCRDHALRLQDEYLDSWHMVSVFINNGKFYVANINLRLDGSKNLRICRLSFDGECHLGQDSLLIVA